MSALALAGCATAPPATYAVSNSRIYPSSQEAMFERVLAVSARNNLFMTASDKRSGVLTFERPIVSPPRSGTIHDWADCGGVSLTEQPLSQLAELNMVVEPMGGSSRVTINTRFSELRQDIRHNTRRLSCTSTGALERAMLEAFAR